jgi:hypothetical protein
MVGYFMNTNEAKGLISRIRNDLKELAAHSDDGFELTNDAESKFDNAILCTIASKAYDIIHNYEYMKRSVKAEGFLFKRPDGRFGIQGTSEYFTSGSPIEIWDEDDEMYIMTRIEHGEDYYALHYKNQELEGLKARYR